MSKKKMTVLVTGGAGMVGSHCAEHYAKQGHHVIVYDNLMRSKIFASKKKSVEYNWHYLHQYKNITFLKEDIRNTAVLNQCFKKYKPDVVIHTAGQPGVRFSIEDPLEDFSINALGTLNVLEALRTTNPKGTFLYCSTNKVYGDNVNLIPLVEKRSRYAFKKVAGVSEAQSIDFSGHTPYGVSKLAGDLYVQDYAYSYKMKVGVFRMSCIYGTRQFGFEDQGWLAWFAINFLAGKPITIYGDGKQVRDVLWVGDLVNAFDKFIKSPLQYEVFNMGGGPKNTLSLLELVDILKDVTGNSVKVKFEGWRKFDQKVYISSIDKAKKKLGWKPTVSPQQGVERIVEWIRANKKLME